MIKVAVIFGGSSVEHEVSIITAMQAAAALDRTKYDPVALYITKDRRFFTGGDLLDIEAYRDIPAALGRATQVTPVWENGRSYLMSYPPKTFGKGTFIEIDAALVAGHGTNVEDGTLQGLLEYWGVPYSGCDVTASACGMDKWVMKSLFKSAGLPCLDGILLNKTAYYADLEASLDNIEKQVGYPLIVKPSNLGSSVGISKANDREKLREAMETAFSYAAQVLVESAVQNLREINCAVLGDVDGAIPSVCEEPLNATDILTFSDKYMGGSSKTGAKTGVKAPAKGASKGASGMASLSRKVPADLPEDVSARIQELAVRAFHAIGASGVARVDFLMDGVTGEVYINEINTAPGSLSYYLWEECGMSFTELTDRLISLALKKQRDKEKLTFSFETNLLANVKLPSGGKTGGKM